MRITVIGAGGVGGYFGAKLAKSGCEVNFVARGPHLAAMRQNGLRVESQLGDLHLPIVNLSDDPAAFGAPDYVFLAVKLWDTEPAARPLAKIMALETAGPFINNCAPKDSGLATVKCVKAML